uniref:Secreted protein n=1 Tax=Haemonchus placei TaxID=6290 RepID=A0A0N4W8C6_HAEPC
LALCSVARVIAAERSDAASHLSRATRPNRLERDSSNLVKGHESRGSGKRCGFYDQILNMP